jgi:hypothetical protein
VNLVEIRSIFLPLGYTDATLLAWRAVLLGFGLACRRGCLNSVELKSALLRSTLCPALGGKKGFVAVMRPDHVNLFMSRGQCSNSKLTKGLCVISHREPVPPIRQMCGQDSKSILRC